MDDLLQQGIQAYRAGKRDEARKFFIAVVKQSQNDERAWGWMYNVCDTDKERIHCLNQMLRVNPKNEKANELLTQLTNRESPIQQSISAVPQNNLQSQVPSLKKCPYCAEMIQESAIVCRFCGRDLRTGMVNTVSNLPPAQTQLPKQQKWYRDPAIKILTFLFLTPLWAVIVIDDPDSALSVKIVAGVLLVVYLLFCLSNTFWYAFLG